ncbi:hypothetical protein MVES_002228 [Malassezia vespertilionis]|uniref:Pre-mRNA-splicing factor 38 n=1 Tax=Malassezia vespertilionis TaxID=2020962 RepID=A0A2N1JBA8_9BASI|nr:hypothetical protein MVES_002228 [Malassezia vespertilionis]
MANTTARNAHTIHGTNPQFLIERIVRARIYDSPYWKEDCFALNAATLVDKAAALQYVGGTFGLQRPSPFLCLVCKLLQLQPEREIVLAYLEAEDLKYLRALAAMYVRMTFPPMDVYELLEPLLDDYRKVRWRDMAGQYSLSHMDEFVFDLLTEERVCGLILPRLTRRALLEEKGLRPRRSKLETALVLGDAEGLADEAYASDDSMQRIRTARSKKVQDADRTRAALRQREANALGYAVEEDYASQQEEEEEERMFEECLAGQEEYFAGQEECLAGQEEYFAGQEECLAGQEEYFAGQEECLAGQEEYFAGQEECLAGQEEYFAGQKYLAG